MSVQISKFTLRVPSETLRKIRYIAGFSARSANKELEVIMKKHIAEFEKKHGAIVFDD